MRASLAQTFGPGQRTVPDEIIGTGEGLLYNGADNTVGGENVFLLLLLFGAGLVHGLGPDHLAAIAALASRGAAERMRRRQAARLGLRFGLGHVTTLTLLAGVAWVLGRNLPDAWQRGLEQVGGVVLIFLGGWILAQALRRRVFVHSHPHEHTHDGRDREHRHPHIHLVGRLHGAHRHPHLPFLVGGLLGFSGAQSLLVALPVVVAGSLADALARIAAFGLGIVVSMALAGWAAQAAFARLAATPRYARLLVALTGTLSAALGVYWLARFAAG